MARASGKRVGVVLSGCGVQDGAEIQEAVIGLLALDRAGATVRAAAPDVDQMHVVDHLTGKPVEGRRNVLVESARIVRGKIESLAGLRAADLDALLFPGGFGAAKNLCSFAVHGAKLQVNPEVERIVREAHTAKKPIGFVCIAPVIAAKVLGAHRPRLTIGDDPQTAAAIEAMGGKHVVRKVEEIELDEPNRIVSTPAYMLGPTIAAVAQGVERLVDRLLELA